MRSFNLTILALLSISTSTNGQFSKVVKSVSLPVTLPPIASSFVSIATADGNNTILGVQEPSDSSSVNSILPQNLLSAVVVGKKMEVTKPSAIKRDFGVKSSEGKVTVSSDSPAPFVPAVNQQVQPFVKRIVGSSEIVRRLEIPIISTTGNNSISLPSTKRQFVTSSNNNSFSLPSLNKKDLSITMNGTRISQNSNL